MAEYIDRAEVIEYIQSSDAELAHSTENDLVCKDMNYHNRQHRKWFLQYQCSIVRHVHSATTPLGKTLRHT